jgi:hypothetical protein
MRPHTFLLRLRQGLESVHLPSRIEVLMPRLIVFGILLSLAAAPIFAQEVTGSPAVTAQYRDPETIARITNRLAGRGRESWNTVIAAGEPALTWGAVATFSLLLTL